MITLINICLPIAILFPKLIPIPLITPLDNSTLRTLFSITFQFLNFTFCGKCLLWMIFKPLQFLYVWVTITNKNIIIIDICICICIQWWRVWLLWWLWRCGLFRLFWWTKLTNFADYWACICSFYHFYYRICIYIMLFITKAHLLFYIKEYVKVRKEI